MACDITSVILKTGATALDACSSTTVGTYSIDVLSLDGVIYEGTGCLGLPVVQGFFVLTGTSQNIWLGTDVAGGKIVTSGVCAGTTVQFRSCENGEIVFRFRGGTLPSTSGETYLIGGTSEFDGCATIVGNDGSGPLYDSDGITFTLVTGCGDINCPRTDSKAAILSKCSDGTIYYFNVDADTAFPGGTYLYNSECYSFIEFGGAGGSELGSPLFSKCSDCSPTPTPTRTPNPTPTNTPTPSITPPPCAYTDFCLSVSLSSISGYSGTYSSTGLNYNSKLYYTGNGVTSAFIYYNNNAWCLSNTLGGSCVLQGKTPCISACPDLDPAAFTTGICPSPTPLPADCSLLDFNAYFDCNYTPPVTPSQPVDCGDINFDFTNIGVTPTPSNSPVYVLGLNFSIAYASPTPTPSMTATPTLTPSNRVQFGGRASYVILDPPLNCPVSAVLTDCLTPTQEYYVGTPIIYNNIPLTSGIYFNALITDTNGTKNVCVKYDRNSPNYSPNTTINQIYSLFGSCDTCMPPSATPQSTPTNTPTLTKTQTSTPTNTPTNTKTPTNTPTNTKTPTNTPTNTPTQTQTQTQTPTNTETPTQTPTQTQTQTPTNTETPTQTPTQTTTQTPTPTRPLPNFTGRFTTTNTSVGSSNSDQVKLPFISGAGSNYSCIIDWGDSSTDYVNTWSASSLTHTYASPGTYTINIYADTGNLKGWVFNNSGDKLKLVEVLKWGPLQLGAGITVAETGHFYGCSNLVLTGVTDVLNLSGTTYLNNTFRDCSSLTTVNRMNEWDVSNVTRASRMFQSCSNFNQNISSWKINNLTDTTFMFALCSKFNQNVGYDPTNDYWNVSKVTNMQGMFNSCFVFNNSGFTTMSGWTTTACTNTTEMFFDCFVFNQNLGSEVVTVSSYSIGTGDGFNPTFTFNLGTNKVRPGSVIITDGVETFTDNRFSGLTGNLGGTGTINYYTGVGSVTFNTVPALSQNITSDFEYYTGKWDMSNNTSIGYMFHRCFQFNNGNNSLISKWNTHKVINMGHAFWQCQVFNQPIGNWDTRIVGTTQRSPFNEFRRVLGRCYIFNQDMGGWVVSGAANMGGMFEESTNFNNSGSTSISGWIPYSATNMSSMFALSKFNQPIGNWNVSTVQSFNNMFASTPFNQDIGNWNVSAATDMGAMFKNNTKFDNSGSTSISAWTVNNVLSMSEMFFSSWAFDRDISNWDTRKVQNMSSMFQSAIGFNNGGSPNISGWTTSGVTNMFQMFYDADLFNQPIGNWDTSNVINMSGMFYRNDGFDQPIESWDVSKVQNMSSMFRQASGFTQSLSGWSPTSATTLQFFMTGLSTTYSTDNYNNLLIRWSTLPLQQNVIANFGSIQSSGATALSAKDTLTGVTYNWTITDGGHIP